MKTLIDRTYGKFSEIINKDMYFIVLGADTNKESLERTIEGFRAIYLLLFRTFLKRGSRMGPVHGTLGTSKAAKPWMRPTKWERMSDARNEIRGITRELIFGKSRPPRGSPLVAGPLPF